jgi:hypothetical protein
MVRQSVNDVTFCSAAIAAKQHQFQALIVEDVRFAMQQNNARVRRCGFFWHKE